MAAIKAYQVGTIKEALQVKAECMMRGYPFPDQFLILRSDWRKMKPYGMDEATTLCDIPVRILEDEKMKDNGNIQTKLTKEEVRDLTLLIDRANVATEHYNDAVFHKKRADNALADWLAQHTSEAK